MAAEGGLTTEPCDRILETFKIDSLKELQRRGLEALIKGQDVFIVQPTGSGKSLIFQSGPIVFDIMEPLPTGKSVVISPLVSLMEDQVRFLKSIGIVAEFVGDDQKDEDAKNLKIKDFVVICSKLKSSASVRDTRCVVLRENFYHRILIVTRWRHGVWMLSLVHFT